MDHQAQRLKDATGAALLGMDSGQWPAWWADAVACFEVQRVLEHNARSRAEIEEAKRQQR
jgi:hypothetical protein